MKTNPIIFSGPMVRAILKSQKTQTRRIIKPQPTGDAVIYDPAHGWRFTGGPNLRCPYGISSDRLWVRETWALLNDYEATGVDAPYYEYKADTGAPYPGQWPEDEAKGNPDAPKWKASIHMPRRVSRITLEVEAVRAERLHDITNEDAITEGLQDWYCTGKGPFHTNIERFEAFWDHLNEKRGYPWNMNPWVWVIEFE